MNRPKPAKITTIYWVGHNGNVHSWEPVRETPKSYWVQRQEGGKPEQWSKRTTALSPWAAWNARIREYAWGVSYHLKHLKESQDCLDRALAQQQDWIRETP